MIQVRIILISVPVLILLWIGLSPKGNFPGIQYFSFFVIFFLAAMVPLLKPWRITITPFGVLFILVFLLWWTSLIASFVININDVRIGSFFEVGRPLLLAMLFLCGYLSFKENGASNWEYWLISSSKFLLLIMLLVSVIQLLYPDFFSFIWSSEKTSGLGGIVRVTGTMYNPNSFAFFVSVLCLGVVAHTGIKRSWFWIMIALVLVILASSRTMMLAFPVALVMMYWLNAISNGILTASFKMIAVFGIFMTVILVGVSLFSEYLPYASQILTLLKSPEAISEVSSFAARDEQWGQRLAYWISKGTENILFGAGSTSELRVGDSDLLYVLFRLGLFGALMHLSLYFIFFYLAWNTRRHKVGIWFCGVMTLTVISGITVDTLAGWQFSMYVFMIAGAAYAAYVQYAEPILIYKKQSGVHETTAFIK